MSSIELTKLWVEIIQGIFTALGILAAGIWSLLVFGLGRSFAPNIHFGFICKQVVALQVRQGVILTLKIKNTGHTRIKKETCTLIVVAVASLPNTTETDHRAFRRLVPIPSEIVAQLPRRFELFADHDAFEPNEEASEDILLELGDSPVFKVVATFFGAKYLFGRKQQWTSSSIMDVRTVTNRKSPEEEEKR